MEKLFFRNFFIHKNNTFLLEGVDKNNKNFFKIYCFVVLKKFKDFKFVKFQ